LFCVIQLVMGAAEDSLKSMIEDEGRNFKNRFQLVARVEAAGFKVRRRGGRTDAWVVKCKNAWLRALLDNQKSRFPHIPVLAALYALFNPRAMPDDPAGLKDYGTDHLETVIAHVTQAESVTVERKKADSDEMEVVQLFDADRLREQYPLLRRFAHQMRGEEVEEVVLVQADDVNEEDLNPFEDVPKKKEVRKTPVSAAHVVQRWLTNPTLLSLCADISGLASWYTILTNTSVDCERGVSALKQVHTDLRNRLKQSTLEMLLYIKINGPPIDEFDFHAAAKLFVHRQDRRFLVSTLTTAAQRKAAKELIAVKWGDEKESKEGEGAAQENDGEFESEVELKESKEEEGAAQENDGESESDVEVIETPSSEDELDAKVRTLSSLFSLLNFSSQRENE
jgi:hypothetical protein